MINYDLIPKHILNEGVFLKEIGIFEYAWTFSDIKKIIGILNENRIPILGGDVYKTCNGEIYQTYDSWYIVKADKGEFCSRSYEETIGYISNYERRNAGEYRYSIVF